MPGNKKIFCTTKEASEILSVSLRTAQLWTESGLLEAWKTSGGHRRISRLSIDRLLSNPETQLQTSFVAKHELKNENDRHRFLSILVVEDDISLRRLYEINIRNWNLPINLSTALDGYEALIRIGQVKPDILIADLNLPGMDGFRLLYTVCSLPELTETQIIVVTGLPPDEITNRGGIPDGIPVFPKPIPFEKIKAIVEAEATKRQMITTKEIS